MHSKSRLRFLLFLSLAWGVISFAASITSFVREDDVRQEATMHEIHHILAESSPQNEDETVDYLRSQWGALNRLRLWHGITALILVGISLLGITLVRSSPDQ